ncbi:hypothetical protein PFICI_13878 [Pestalotiopsis fici W106-1]|uniref:Uncharacterized protein n=1 Tax=Pestalotiopsis fici (strain W106-1 / CGMCC3.15140) TaxID=1229662 RepID=W3WLG3_PESFW|nr:uncharacterized protein PFICI_13878 [Pestalotiopsis fici W106-1]ETS74012.1 hypothetical protein PFICI_13878 [Pestalotiopsis fici W106-1]
MDFSECSDDQSLGPSVQHCRDGFDFTIKFELVFFSILPASIFVAVALARIACLFSKQAIIGGAILQSAKLVSACAWAALQLALLALSGTREGRFKSFFVSSSAVSLAAALCMIAASYLEHSRSPRPSIVLNAYLALSVLLDVAQTRTLWLASTGRDERLFTTIFTAALGVKFLLAVLETRQKTKWIRWNEKEHSPEETSGLFELGAFAWLNRLFSTGYRKTLTLDELFPLDKNVASEPLQASLSHHLGQIPQPGQKHGLAKALARSLAIPLLLPIGPRLAMTALQFCQPFLISLLLDYLQRPSDASTKNIGYGLIGATFLVYLGLAFSGAIYWYLQERVMYMARGALAGVVYRKVVAAKLSATQDSSALTLMSADIERIISGGLNLHEFWANAIQVGLASWLLSRDIGPSAIAPLIVVFCCFVSSSILSKVTVPRQKTWMEKIQKRVGVIASAVGQIKQIKVSGLAAMMEESIQKLRVDELESASKFRMVITVAAIIANVPLCISPILMFVFASHTLDVTTIFTAVSYVLLLATPLGMLLQTMPAFLSTFTCLSRIQEFLEKESQIDFRKSPLKLDQKTPTYTQEQTRAGDGTAPLIKVSDGSFGWEIGKPCVSNINIEIPSSKLTIIVGPVASGKSTLCKALIGEVPIAQGSVEIDVSNLKVGYCDQTPLLFNSTIRENITAFATMNESRYQQVLDATLLQQDLASLPMGDESKIGSNGITLSGGQKQRVALARALFLDADLLVFDDILSSLDAITSEHVFRNVFSNHGILRQREATVVLCTHATQRLLSADHIIALRADGTIEEQGSYSELVSNKGYIYGLIASNSKDAHPRDNGGPSLESIQDAPKPTMPRTAKNLPTKFDEEKKRMTGDFSVYRHYFSRINTVSIVLFIAFGAGWGFFSNFTTIWLKFWSEDITSTFPNHSGIFYIALYALFQISTLACLLGVCLVCFRSMIQVSGAKLHKEALSTVMTAPLKFFSTTDTGVVTNLFSQDMNLIDGELPLALINLSNRLFTTLGMAAVVATSSAYLVITFPIMAIFLYGLQKFYLRTSRQLRLLDLEAKSPLYSQFIDTIKGVATIRALGWAKNVIATNDKFLDRSQRPAYLLAMIQRWLQFVLQLLVALLATIVVALATQLRSNSAFAGASLVTLMTFGNSLSFLIRVYTVVETSIGSVSRLKTFSESVVPENLPGEDVVPPPQWPMKGAIDIRGVSASYGEGTVGEQSRPLALDDIHLSIGSGEKVAICGRTGRQVGKSSIILLLLRLVDPLASCSENITIDGTPLYRVDRSVLRQRIIAVPQEPVFLPNRTSFQTNLDPQGAATEADCTAVLELVGLDVVIDERGGLTAAMNADDLSQGQKQLFSLARAALRRRAQSRAREAALGNGSVNHDGGILLLDELSSSVDRETERIMHKVIRQEFAAYTVVMISHRLEMVMDLDTVVVLDSGRVVESGKPKELIQQEGSKFKELWKSENR